MSNKPTTIAINDKTKKAKAQVPEILGPNAEIFNLVRRCPMPRWGDWPSSSDSIEVHTMPNFEMKRVQQICATMRDTYLPYSFAAQALGIPMEQAKEYLATGIRHLTERTKSPEAYLAFHIGRTQSKLIAKILHNMFVDGAGKWQRWAWYLERLHNDFKASGAPGKQSSDKDTLQSMAEQYAKSNPAAATLYHGPGSALALPAIVVKEEEL